MHAPLPPQNNFMNIREESFEILLGRLSLIMKSLLLDGVKKMVKSSGRFEILGEHIGEKMDTLELFEEKTILQLKMTAFGLHLRITGKTSFQQNLFQKSKKRKMITST